MDRRAALHRRQMSAQHKAIFFVVALFCMCSALLTSLYVAHIAFSQPEAPGLPPSSPPGRSVLPAAQANASPPAAAASARQTDGDGPQQRAPLRQTGGFQRMKSSSVRAGSEDFVVVLAIDSGLQSRLEASKLLWQVRSSTSGGEGLVLAGESAGRGEQGLPDLGSPWRTETSQSFQ